MKKYQHGLIIGKFLPFHLGHSYLIESAMGQCDKLTVLVCSIENEPIPGVLRYGWIKEMFPKVDVQHITDNAPLRAKVTILNAVRDVDDSDEKFWDVWMGIIDKHTSNIDVLFTSETYGFELADRLSVKNNFKIDHIVVDNARSKYPISGTKIRTNPYEHWDYIPDVARPYFVKKIALVGPESTGKSTLTKKLAEHYKTSYVEEYGREVTRDRDMKISTKEFSLEDISNIASGQLYREEIAFRKANKIVFCDTELITTKIWSDIYFHSCPQWIRDVISSRKKFYNLYLLLNIDVPWIDDGSRHFSNYRKEHFNLIERELIAYNLPYAIVGGNYNERFEMAINAVGSYVITNYL